MGTWLLIACLTSYYLLLQQYYYTNRGTNNSNNKNNNNNNNSWVLLGGLTATTISFRIRATDTANLKHNVNDMSESRRQRLVVTTDPKWEDVVFEREFVTHVPNTGNNNEYDDNNDTASEVLNIDIEESGSALVHSVTVTDLTPNTRYYYVIFEFTTMDDNVDLSSNTQPQHQHQGQFMTAPNEGEARDFQFIASACSWTGSDVPIYTQILEQEILQSTAVAAVESATTTIETKPSSLFFFHLGDFHYENLDVDSLERRIDAIDNVLSSAKQQRLWANVPLAVMWDDHDWLGNNRGGDTSQIGYEAALESYRVAFPHYEPLPSSSIDDKCNNNNSTNSENATTTTTTTSNNNNDDDDGNCNNNINNNNLYGNRGVYQAFTIGTVRFIMSDLRSEASESSIYSPEQREWLFKELEDSMKYDFVVWMSTGPWIGTAKEGSDTWRGHSRDRKELSLHIQRTVTNKNLLVLAADAHMVAFDDGSNTFYGENDKQYATGLNTTSQDPEYTRSFPILQTGPLDRMGSVKGGPYSDGCHTYFYERNHQYSVINFQLENRDEPPCLTIRSYDQSNLIFTKKLCGPDIFGNSRNVEEHLEEETVGSCKAMYFSSTKMTLLIIAACMLMVAFVLTYFVFLGCCVSFGIAMMILIFLVATFAAGFIIPVALGIEQYEAFETIVICILQITTVVLYLSAWQFCSDKSNNGENDATTVHNHEEEKAC
jgi:hypothetical protein